MVALNHVHETVTREIQDALVNIEYHAKTLEIHQRVLCETTPYLSKLAYDASVAGGYARFRTARSYGMVRSQQEDAGFLFYDEDSKKWECINGEKLWEDLKCPKGQMMLPEEQFKKSCEVAGLGCDSDYECFCQPCIKAFEVDVFQFHTDQNVSRAEQNISSLWTDRGCDKMELCGQVQQTKEITFRAIDHHKRLGAEVEVLMHIGGESITIPVETIGPFTYEFNWSHNEVSVVVMEVFFDGEQIPESPFRVQVLERQCNDDHTGKTLPQN